MNFETVLFYKNKEDNEKKGEGDKSYEFDRNIDLNRHTVLAVQGFFK